LYGVQTFGLTARYSTASRPDASYYCYDCHGYRYFDPYYDWCTYYGFRYRWTEHPRAIAVYRERYVRIRENHPDYGRFRYREGYRNTPRYRDERDYDQWQRNPRTRSGGESRPEKPKRRGRDAEPQERPNGRGRERGGDTRLTPDAMEGRST